MKTHRFVSIPILVAFILSACSGVGSKDLPAEPTGGNWTPILLGSPDAIRLAAPPAANLPEEQTEIEELIEFQKQRTNETQTKVEFWNAGANVRWNEIARDLVAKHRTVPPMAARLYALLSVAQYDALVAAWNNKYFYNRQAPETVTSRLNPLVVIHADPVYPSEHATVAAASAAVLAYYYPDEVEFLESKVTEHAESRLWAGVNFRSDMIAGDSLGREVAQIVIEYAQTDSSDAEMTGTIPAGEGYWFSAINEEPLLPMWGQVKPWLMASGDQFRSEPPPAYDSPDFQAGLAEVKQISDARTQEQARIAALWADDSGSYTPAGRWNKIASDLILKYELNEIRAARAFALLNMAMMDAGISCWNTKFHYLVIRPSMADPSITTPVGLPNFPAYTSGHSAFSGAGAEVLGYLFPEDKKSLWDLAEEASLSRIYGGIHYRFDGEAVLGQGQAVAQLAIERGRSDGSP
ncbi:MAG: phosphatase PAP2 family protein [Anaerolineales bacterium]